MTYNPSETEKTIASGLQAAAVLLFFLPGVIIRKTRWWGSPYVRLWAKASQIWSIFTFIPFATLLVLGQFTEVGVLAIVVWSVHALMSISCAFAAMFNRPVGYFLITERYCARELAGVYGATLSPEEAEAWDESPMAPLEIDLPNRE